MGNQRHEGIQTILHVTDPHFGWEGEDPNSKAIRQVCLDGMLHELKNLEHKWRPTVICITGDMAWRGSESDYAAAKEWLDKLLAVCGLSYNDVIMCSGNHDVIRSKAQRLPRPESTKDADEVLAVPIAEHFEGPFSNFISFCKRLGIPQLKFGDYDSHLVGECAIRGLRFVVLNSAWFSKDDNDKGKLWVGLPHIKYLEAKSQLHPITNHPEAPITIALLHHPGEWLHSDEQHASTGRQNTLDYLAHRCHLLLTGHTHGEVRRADRIADGALHFTGGAAYAGASHFNSFRLIQISREQVVDRAFEFDPLSSENRWRPHPATSRPLTYQKTAKLDSIDAAPTFNTEDLRAAFRKAAVRHRELKSRLLRQVGSLPATIERPVSLRVSQQRNQYDTEGRLVRVEAAEQTTMLYDAVRDARCTLLLGDLGSGKSTLGSELVIQTIDRSQTAIAILIPAKTLQLTGQFTLKDLLKSIDRYVSGEVLVSSSDFSLASILEHGIEVMLAFDGLDELARDIAGRLLRRAAALAENWPNIQVLSTARPIELVGVSYADWRIVHTVPLDDAAKFEFIKQELIADGIPSEQVHAKASTVLESLKQMPALDSIANSPLAIRLIYPRLCAAPSGVSVTLGDLLLDLLIERLEGWKKRDDKPSTYPQLEQSLPTPEEKAEFLAVLAERAIGGKSIKVEEAKTLLEDKAATINGANKYQLASEAISFFEWLGLIIKTDAIEFPSQPLAEICAAVAHFTRWRMAPEQITPAQPNLWRVVSFVTAIARRRGLTGKLRSPIAAYFTTLLAEPAYVPAMCYIVVEAADREIAQIAVSKMDELAFRPLTVFQDDRGGSSKNIAKTLSFAGDLGFDWFYKDYLDPRCPIPNAGSAVIRDVFAEWGALAQPLSTVQKKKLTKLVEPFRATGEGHFYGVLTILSVLVPEAFSSEDRLWYQSSALDDRHFASLVRQEFARAKADEQLAKVADNLLLHRSEGRSAAKLWLDWHPTVEPPYSIIRLAMESAAKRQVHGDYAEIREECCRRLGTDRWLRCCKWALLVDGGTVGGGAAKVLYDAGEERLAVIGDAALQAVRDVGQSLEAEKAIALLIKREGDKGVRWIASRIAESREWHGAESGWWRLLLEAIETVPAGPKLLAACSPNLGPYTLPRYPEVREAFRRILHGSRGGDFRKELRAVLTSLDPMARRGAASILIASDPHNEADALFVAVRSRAKRHNYDWNEWETFLLTLDFGPTVLAALQSKLTLLDPQSRALALVLLDRGGLQLEPTYRAELMITLSTLDNWNLTREPAGRAVLNTEDAFARLQEQLDKPSEDLAQRAAERLLDFHRKRLTPMQEAKCLAIRHGRSSWTWELADIMQRIVRDPVFAENARQASKDVRAKQGSVPIVGLVAEAVKGEVEWKDIIWTLICDDTKFGGSSEAEGGGMALLEFGFSCPDQRVKIGEAAKVCLADPRMHKNRWHDAYHWLALLADEFSGLEGGVIEKAILHGKPIYYSATTALIARLGRVPENFTCERATNRRPPRFGGSGPVVRDQSKIVQQLKDFSRDSDELHPSLLATLQECVFLPPFDESLLSEFTTIGKPGILISTTLRFLYGMPPNFVATIPLLDRWMRILFDERDRAHWKQLARAWRIVRESAFADDPSTAAEYIAALDKALTETDVWKLPIALDILVIEGQLRDSQVSIVFASYADHPTYLHEELFTRFCRWLPCDLSETTKHAVVSAAEGAMVAMNEVPWSSAKGEQANPWADLLFPTIQWAFSGKSSTTAEAVFLRGIAEIFAQFPNTYDFPRTNLVSLLGKLAPLLAKVPPEILGKVLRRGIEAPETSVAAFCRLIEAFNVEPAPAN